MDIPLCSKCEAPMVLRTARSSGSKFWGCSNFPQCKGTLPLRPEDNTSDYLRISGKNLGGLALPDFCRRCFWIKLHLSFKLPYQIFPGIFPAIDSYSKNVVHNYFDAHKRLPDWLSEFGQIKGYVDNSKLYWSKFFIEDSQMAIHLNGSPDDIFIYEDGHAIVDYKTAKFSDTQDELLPMYEVQLNAYAYIAERLGFSPIRTLALCYTEPVTERATVNFDEKTTEDGFLMGFSAKIKLVERKSDEFIISLLKQTRDIYDIKSPPNGVEGCKDCNSLSNLLNYCYSA